MVITSICKILSMSFTCSLKKKNKNKNHVTYPKCCVWVVLCLFFTLCSSYSSIAVERHYAQGDL